MAELLWTFAIEGCQDVIDVYAEIDKLTGGSTAALARSELGQLGGVMKQTLDEAAQEALNTAAYAARTGNLDASTYAGDVVVNGDRIECEFGARAKYASFVERRGFSRTEDVATKAEAVLTDRINALAARLAK